MVWNGLHRKKAADRSVGGFDAVRRTTADANEGENTAFTKLHGNAIKKPKISEKEISFYLSTHVCILLLRGTKDTGSASPRLA